PGPVVTRFAGSRFFNKKIIVRHTPHNYFIIPFLFSNGSFFNGTCSIRSSCRYCILPQIQEAPRTPGSTFYPCPSPWTLPSASVLSLPFLPAFLTRSFLSRPAPPASHCTYP